MNPIELDIAFVLELKDTVMKHVVKVPKEHKSTYTGLILMPDLSLARDYLDGIGLIMIQDIPDMLELPEGISPSFATQKVWQAFKRSELVFCVSKDDQQLFKKVVKTIEKYAP
jgi:hypothetical protein